jgi:hypothetical protein
MIMVITFGNACYYLVQNLLPSYSLYKKVKTNTHKITVLSVVLYAYETFLTLKEERRLRVLENMSLRRTVGPVRVAARGGTPSYFVLLANCY